ncbi:MAG: YcxB family protein [Chloroflexi bacterium]|nr:YcxB family protein [Chloroflexota bacterium]
MRIAYDVTRADIEGLMLYHYQHGAATSALRTVTQLVLPAIAAGGLTVWGIVQGAWPLPILGLLLGLVLRLVMPRTMAWSIRASVARILAQGGSDRLLGRHALEIREDGLVDCADDEDYLHPWDELADVVALPDRAYVYVGAREAYVIARERVREGDYQGFVRNLEKRLESTATQ